ncbi:hypothetical protein ACFXHA_01150 [Nocardia sp. NPDC059240]|uniref:hypothetical protein n=1 Tax=Nocardia sp. NPDC059240 TaxID=3346786 RepID=UPI0036BE1081
MSSVRQQVDEFPCQGTSGPFAVSKANAIYGTEKVEVVVRDRHQPGVILATTILRRSVDYEFDPYSGRVLLMQAPTSVDFDGNPQSLRVTYETDADAGKSAF